MIIGLKGNLLFKRAKDLKKIDTKHYVPLYLTEYVAKDDGIKRYVGVACLLSDIGFDVLLNATDDVMAELSRRQCNAVVLIPDYLCHGRTFESYHASSMFNDRFHVMRFQQKASATILHAGIQKLKTDKVFKLKTSTHDFIWGTSNNEKEVADAYTDNLITLWREKETGDYTLIVDEDIIDKEDMNTLQELLVMLTSWYVEQGIGEQEEGIASGDTLKTIYDGLDIMSGKTIQDIILKVGVYLVLAGVKNPKINITISR